MDIVKPLNDLGCDNVKVSSRGGELCVTFDRPAPRTVRVVKKDVRADDTEYQQRRAEIAVMKIYIAKYPDIARATMDNK